MTGEEGRLGSKEWSERSSVASPSPEWVLSSCYSSSLELQPHFNRKTIRIKFCQFFTNLELDSSTLLWALTKPAVEQILLFWCLHVDLKNVSRSWIEKSFAVNSFSDYKALELLLQRDSTVAAVSNSSRISPFKIKAGDSRLQWITNAPKAIQRARQWLQEPAC